MNPEKIGKYRVIELLGRGGMGEVYLGEDPYIGRRVAIKMIKGADPEARDRFRHEARVVGGLAHPSIVALLDFDFSGEEPFLVMEYLKGEGLDAWIKNPHSLAEQLVVLDDLGQALAFAHDNGVLHRDVKPSNVQILPNGHAKLMDFGIARGSGGKLTATGAVVGTPEYMAPEILNDAAYSVRSDLFSCAVLLYEMFTGANPFTAKTVAASLTNVLTLDPPHLHSVRPEIPEGLCDVIMACLRKAPEQRPDGLGALIAAGREASGQAREAVPETRALPQKLSAPAGVVPPTPSVEALSSKKRPGLWAGVLGVGVMIGLASTLSRMGGPAPALPEAPAPTSSAEPTMTPGPAPTVVETATPTPQPLPPAAARSQAATPSAALAGRPGPGVQRAGELPANSGSPTTPSSSPQATPMPAPAAVIVESTPPVGVVPTPSPQSAATPMSAPALLPSIAPPTLSTVLPRTVRRGSSVVLEISGNNLRADLKALVLQGRRAAAGIKVVKQEFAGPTLFKVTILIEPEVPLLTYTVVFQDPSGVSTPGLQIEVVL